MDGLPQLCVGGKIEGGSAVVQDQDLRVPHHGTGDGQALFLAAGEIAPLLFDRKIEALSLLVYKFSGLGNIERLVDLFVCGIVISPFHIVAKGSLKEYSLLGNDADAGAEILLADVADVFPVQGHRTGIRVIESRKEIDQCALSGTGSSDDAEGGACVRVKADVIERGGGAFLIGKGDVIEVD